MSVEMIRNSSILKLLKASSGIIWKIFLEIISYCLKEISPRQPQGQQQHSSPAPSNERAGDETQNVHQETVTVVRTPFSSGLCGTCIAVSEKQGWKVPRKEIAPDAAPDHSEGSIWPYFLNASLRWICLRTFQPSPDRNCKPKSAHDWKQHDS